MYLLPPTYLQAGVGTGDGIDDGAGMEEGPCVGTDDGPELAEGLADDPDEVSADGELRPYPCVLSAGGFTSTVAGATTTGSREGGSFKRRLSGRIREGDRQRRGDGRIP